MSLYMPQFIDSDCFFFRPVILEIWRSTFVGESFS